MMKAKFSFFLFFALTLLSTQLLVSRAEAASCNSITISTHPEYPPMGWHTEDGKMNGALLDVARRISKELGVEARLVYGGPWKRVLTKLESGEIDVVTGIYKLAEREKKFDFTVPVAPDPIVMFTAKGREIHMQDWEQLINLKGVSTRGDSWGEEIDTYIDRHLDMRTVNTFEQLFKSIISGRADYGIQGYYPILLNGKKLNYIDLVSIDRNWLKSEMLHIAFSKQSPCRQLVPEFNRVIERFKQSKLIERLTDHYLSCRIDPRVDCDHFTNN